jgi:hypothetical protein
MLYYVISQLFLKRKFVCPLNNFLKKKLVDFMKLSCKVMH